MVLQALPGLESTQPDWAQAAGEHADFLKTYGPYADKYSKQTGIPAAVYLAIGASESNWGKAGSIFGIKGDNPGAQTYDTWEAGPNGERIPTRASFNTYDSPDAAFQDFHKVLSNERYKPATDYLSQTGDAAGFLRRINDAGYATDPNWANNIVSIANQIAPGSTGSLAQHLSSGATGQYTPPAGSLSMLGDSSGGDSSQQEQSSIADQLAAARARRQQQQATVFNTGPAVDPGAGNVPQDISMLGGHITPPGTGDGGLDGAGQLNDPTLQQHLSTGQTTGFRVPDDALSQHLSGGDTRFGLDVSNPADYTTLLEQVQQGTAPPQLGDTYDPNGPAAALDERLNRLLPNNTTLSTLGRAYDSVNPDIPVVTSAIDKYLKPGVSSLADTLVGGPGEAFNQVSSRLGGPTVPTVPRLLSQLGIPTAGEAAAPLIPSRGADIALTVLPEAGKLSKLAVLGETAAADRLATAAFGPEAAESTILRSPEAAASPTDRLIARGRVAPAGASPEYDAASQEAMARAMESHLRSEGLPEEEVQARVARLRGDLTAPKGSAPGATGEEAAAAAASGGGGLPPAGAVPSPAASGAELPELGDSGIQAALQAKREATLPAGRVFGEQGSLQRKVVGALNPAVDLPEDVHVANQARVAVQSSLRTELSNAEVPAYRGLADAFEKDAPKYIGEPGRPLANTWIDYAENPRLYQAGPELEAAKEQLRTVQDASLSKVRSQYGADVGRYQGSDPEAVYVPHQATKDSLETAVASTEASLSSRGTIAKERAYDSLSDRVAKHPEFKPETDPTALADTHASALASMAGNNTFKAGVGGKTLTEVIDETHPGLRQARDDIAQAVQNVKSRIDAAEARAVRHDATLGPLLKEQAAIEERATPRVVALEEADRMTPELRDMRTQLRELSVRETSITNAVERVSGKQAVNSLGLGDARKELQDLTPRLEELRARYHSAAPGDYVMNRKTFRYHDPVTSSAIDSVLQKADFNNAMINGALAAGNTARAVGLGPDFSPLAIQGTLGALSHPEVAIKNGATLAKVFMSEGAFKEAMAADPELVRRFEFASNRRLASASEDVLATDKGLRLPGQPIKKFNDALERVLDYGSLKAFENDSALLQKFGESQNIADHEAASSLSKIIPRIDNAAQGRSAGRVAIEGALPTSRSFTAQPFALAKDYASGLAKIVTARPGELLGREKLALLRGTTLVGGLMTLSISSALLSAEANGRSPVEAVKEVTDPSSSRFMSLILGNKGSIGLGGPLRSAFLGVFRTATQGPAGAVKYAKGRLEPVLGATADVAINQDYKGDPIRTGSDWHQVLQSVQHIAEGVNLLGGGIAQGVRDGGLSGAVTQAASQVGGVNYTERSPYDQRDLEARNRFGKGYGELDPEQKQTVDQLGITPDSDFKKRSDAVHADIDTHERQALDAFKAGDNTAKITDIWHDLGQRRLQASKDLASEFATQIAGFDQSKYDKALDGYYNINETFKDGTPDYASTETKQAAYLASLPADQQDWLKKSLAVTESKKTPERQQYDQYIDARKKAGYFDIDPKDPKAGEKRAALDVANPSLDVASWYYSGTADKAGSSVNSVAAADEAMGLGLPKRPVKLAGYSRALNESPKVAEIYQGVKGLLSDYDAALANPQNQQLHAAQTYQKKYEQLTAEQQSSVRASIARDIQKDHPDVDAALAFFGRSESVASDKAVNYLKQMVDHAGVDPAKDPILSKVKRAR